MNLWLNDYNLSRNEILFASLTLTGGALVTKHWSQSNEAISTATKWGHRIVALIEAIPLLGGLVALIETIAARCLGHNGSSNEPKDIPPPSTFPPPPASSPSSPPHLEFNIPTALTHSQFCKLEILASTLESTLPEYTDSTLLAQKIGDNFVVTRRKKNEPPPLNGKVAQIAPLAGPNETNKGFLIDEGLKVRTFCLELLSNIEDFEMAKENVSLSREVRIKIEEAKEVVRYFLHHYALDKKAGFTDFLHLLLILEENVSELSSLVKRHVDLVHLQTKLPKKEKALACPSPWNKIKTLIHSGLFTKNIVATAEPATKLGLHPIPALPRKQTVVNLFPTLDAINLLGSPYREAGRWLMHSASVVTFQELCHSIKASCDEMRETILQWDDYYLLSIKGKSQEWMADIAYRFLPQEKMPKGILQMEHHSVGDHLFDYLTHSESNNFILFDDGAYSGSQLGTYIFQLVGNLIHAGPFAKKKTLYFVFGHFPKDKYKADCINLEKHNIQAKVLSHHLAENCDTLMQKEHLSPSLMEKIQDLARPDRPLLATEWKRPDFMSTSQFVTEGYHFLHDRTGYGELNVVTPKAERLDGIGPITDIIPPYYKS